MIANTEVLQELANMCHASETGTFFITTTANRACHIIVDNGRITALSYGPHRGEAVVTQLPLMDIERYSFKPNVKMPLAGRSFVDDDVNVLQLLGLDQITPEMQAALDTHVRKRVYRGVEVDEVVANHPEHDEHSAKKKPPRMYRGQIVDDE